MGEGTEGNKGTGSIVKVVSIVLTVGMIVLLILYLRLRGEVKDIEKDGGKETAQEEDEDIDQTPETGEDEEDEDEAEEESTTVEINWDEVLKEGSSLGDLDIRAAGSVNIADLNNNFSSYTVEGALEELGGSSSNWDEAYSWGDHSEAGYLTTSLSSTTYLRLDGSNGPITGNLTLSQDLIVSGDIFGNTTGNLTGNVTGNLTGNVVGDVTGNVTGDLTGDVSGGTVTPLGFTQGSVVFAGAGGTLTQDNPELFWDDTNDRLGIGTTVPASSLDISGGAVATEGSNKVTNGTFDTDTDWTKGTGWTIGSAKATKTAGVAADLEQNVSVTASKMYKIVFAYTRTAGTMTVELGGVTFGTSYTSGNGTKTLYIFTTGTGNLKFKGDSSWAGTIDTVIVTEVSTSLANTTYRDSGSTIKQELRVASTNNLFFGLGSGQYNLSGTQNTAIGSQAGYLNISGVQNSFLGYQAGYSNTTGQQNVFIGYSSGFTNTTGTFNTFLGTGTGYYNTTGASNAFLGYFAGSENTTGTYNTFVGPGAAIGSQTGSNNVAIGRGTLGQSTYAGGTNPFTGADNNTIIGYQAGYKLGQDDDGNVMLGYLAGSEETGSNKLYIENSGSTTPLIGGDFSTDILIFNGKVGIGTNTPDEELDVDGDIEGDLVTSSDGSGHICYAAGGANGGVYLLTRCASSSNRYKENITDLSSNLGLTAVEKLRPVTFDYQDWYSKDGKNVGFIAEEVEKISPLLVNYNSKGQVENVKYEKITALLVKAVQEQQEEITALQLGGQIANGSLKVDKLEVTNEAVFRGIVTAYSDLNVKGDFTVDGHVKLNNDNAGVVSIKAGEDQVKITYSVKYSENPTVIVMPKGENILTTDLKFSVVSETPQSFVIKLDKPAVENLSFSWLAFE